MKFIRVFFAILLFVSFQSRAALLFFDSFSDYNSAALNSQLGGLGGKGHWGAVDWPEGPFSPPDKGQYRFVVSGTSLSGNIATYAKRVVLPGTSTNCEIKRLLGIPLGQNGTTRYLRFLMRADYPPGNLWPIGVFLGLELRSDTQSRLYIGKGGSSGGFAIGTAAGQGYVSDTNAFVASTTYVIVLKMQFQSGNDLLTLYINPNPNQEPAGGMTRTNLDVGQPDLLCLRANLAMSVDDIAIADSYVDAMNVPALPTVPRISMIPTVAVAEGHVGTNSIPFVATLSTAVSHQVRVSFETTASNAQSSKDYAGKSGTLIFEPGVRSVTNVVGIIGDEFAETSESFFVDLKWPVSATLDTAWYTRFTILNDDLVTATPLKISRAGANLTLSWSANTTGFALDQGSNSTGPMWSPVTGIQQSQPTASTYRFESIQPIQSSDQFFRLRIFSP
jgi:hypothetical protein